jgi:hypothetical protein
MLMGCFTCGFTYFAAVPLALVGAIIGIFARGGLQVAGLTLNLLALVPAVGLAGMIVVGGASSGVAAPNATSSNAGAFSIVSTVPEREFKPARPWVENEPVVPDAPRMQPDEKKPKEPARGKVVLKTAAPVQKGIEAYVEVDGKRVAEWPVGGSELKLTAEVGDHTITVKGTVTAKGKLFGRKFKWEREVTFSEDGTPTYTVTTNWEE